ncbi:hypothetical protein V3C99_015752 [Haemonchus contortus]
MSVVMLGILLALRLVIACNYKPPKPEEVMAAKTEYPLGSRSKRELPWDWIRIKIEYDHSFNLLDEEIKEVVEQLVRGARHFFETTVKVHRLASLQLPPRCKGRSGKLRNSTNCAGLCEKRCGRVIAPQSAHYFGCCTCLGGNNDCNRNHSNCGGRIIDVDFVLFVSVMEDYCEGVLAYAHHCVTDEVTNRPVAGYVNICPKWLHSFDSHKFGEYVGTIKHELIHTFVFSPPLFRFFPGAGKHPRRGPTIPNVVHEFTRVDWETSEGSVIHNVLMMITPKVQEEARRHFNCSTLEGAELEGQGRGKGRGSHWEKRVLENELMTGVSTQVAALSRLTLALFEDSGWYIVNYDNAEDMEWGRNLGCNFATKSCLTWMKSNPLNPYPFCTTYRDSRCSTTRLGKEQCNLVKANEGFPMFFSSEFDYNIENLYHDEKGNSIVGIGATDLADYCPYFERFDNAHEIDINCAFPGTANYSNYSLEIFSPTARCFQLHGKIEVENEVYTVGCYEITCKNNLLMIRARNSKFYPCYQEGQVIDVEEGSYSSGTVKLRIVCPSCSELCGHQYCTTDKFVEEELLHLTSAGIMHRTQSVLVALLPLFLIS